MNIILLQANFKKALSVVSNITSKNISLPVLNNVQIRAIENKIELCSTNLEMGITYGVRGKMEEEGVVLVDAKTVNNYIQYLPNEKIFITQSGQAIKVVCANYKTTINGYNSEEYPLIPLVSANLKLTVSSADLKDALQKVVFAASSAEARQELTGVYFRINDDSLRVAATDGFRLSEVVIKAEKKEIADTKTVAEQLIIPSRTVQELIRILTIITADPEDLETGNLTEINIAENQVKLVAGSMQMVTRIIEGNFPDYQQIIPTSIICKAIMSKNELIRAVKTSSIFSKNDVNDVLFEIDSTEKCVISATGQLGENRVEIPAKIEGKAARVLLNYRYLIEGLQSINGESVRLSISGDNTPCLLEPNKEKDHICIIMPIKQ